MRRSTTEERVAPTGVPGLDPLIGGGLPRSRTTLVTGAPGTGKSVLAFQFVLDGALRHDEPAIFLTFEESEEDFLSNMRSFAWDLDSAVPEHLAVVNARPDATTLHTGEFDLSGLLAGLGHRIDQIGGRRLVLDGLDLLLEQLGDPVRERRELYRLYDWLHQRRLTAILTGKAAADSTGSARLWSLEFLADAVIRLEDIVEDGISGRHLRVLKVRGAAHSADVQSFVIGDGGIEVLSSANLELENPVSDDRISSGVDDLDEMLDGGWYRGSTVLLSGAPGTAKTTLAAGFLGAACQRGEKALLISFDEAPSTILRNLRSVGLDLQSHRESGLLEIRGFDSRRENPDVRIRRIEKLMSTHEPTCLVLDPVSALGKSQVGLDADDAVLRLILSAREQGITTVFTSLLENARPELEQTSAGISTLADTWIHLSYHVRSGERNRALTIIKSRGTGHSNQVRELLLGSEGVRLREVFSEGGEVLMGTLRWEKEEERRREGLARRREHEREKYEARLALAEVEGELATLEAKLEIRRQELQRLVDEKKIYELEETAMRAGTRQRRSSVGEARQQEAATEKRDRDGENPDD